MRRDAPLTCAGGTAMLISAMARPADPRAPHGAPRLRSAFRWLAPALTLLLLGGALASGLHQHREAAHGPCAVCTASLSPAIQSPGSVVSTAPVSYGEYLVVAVAQAPRRIPAPLHSSRAPPAA